MKTEIRFNREWLGALGADGFVRLAAAVQRRAHARARDFRQRYDAGAADRAPRAPLSAGPGLRLGGPRGGRRARRDRPALQPQRRPRHHARGRPRAAGRHDDAAARGHRRRREDVEEPRQLRRRDRAARRDVRQAHEHLRRAHVALLLLLTDFGPEQIEARRRSRAIPWGRSSPWPAASCPISTILRPAMPPRPNGGGSTRRGGAGRDAASYAPVGGHRPQTFSSARAWRRRRAKPSASCEPGP